MTTRKKPPEAQDNHAAHLREAIATKATPGAIREYNAAARAALKPSALAAAARADLSAPEEPEQLKQAAVEMATAHEGEPIDARKMLARMVACQVCGTSVAAGWPCPVDGHSAEG